VRAPSDRIESSHSAENQLRSQITVSVDNCRHVNIATEERYHSRICSIAHSGDLSELTQYFRVDLDLVSDDWSTIIVRLLESDLDSRIDESCGRCIHCGGRIIWNDVNGVAERTIPVDVSRPNFEFVSLAWI
jgi:hypothetical protein